MRLNIIKPLIELANVHRGKFEYVLVPNLIRQRFAAKSLAMTLRTLARGKELVSPLLSACSVVVLHDRAQILYHAVERAEIVARCVYHLLVDTHSFERTVHYLVHRVFRNLAHRSLKRQSSLVEYGRYLPEDKLVLVFAQWHNCTLVY